MDTPSRIHTIIVDLDRTLLHTDKTVSPYTIAVLQECKSRGMQIMVATARPLRTAKLYCEMINADAMVVSNGARIICGSRQTDHAIRPQTAVSLLNAFKRHPHLRLTLETGDVAYSNKPIADYETVLSDDLAHIAQSEGALKILVGLDQPNTLDLVKKLLTDDLYFTVANGHLLQIMDRSATKWNGIQAMLNSSNCLPEETAYFGDDHDDLEPIQKCGMGIAVSNAIDEVKAAADFIAESNDADGVAKFIRHRLLSMP